MENIKKCENCIYYMQHYGKDKTYIFKVSCGHCLNKPDGKPFRKTDKICECFTERDLQQEKQQQQKSVAEYLAYISQRLEDIKEILKD